MKEGVGSNSGSPSLATIRPRHPVPPPPPPGPLLTPGAPGAPTRTPHIQRRLLLPAVAPAFTRPWRRESPALRAHIFRRPAGLGPSTYSSTSWVSFSISTHSTFCCIFHSGHTLRRWSLVCEGHWHHQHWAVGRTLAQCMYCPARACPVFSW